MSAATMGFTPVVVGVKSEPLENAPADAPDAANDAAAANASNDAANASTDAAKHAPDDAANAADAPDAAANDAADAPIAPNKDKDNGRGQFSLTPVCQNCQTSTTPLWRRDEAGQVLCNACGLFLKLHGRARPISLKTNVIKSRNRIKNHGHGPGNPAVAHGVQYSVVSASHMPHVHPQHPPQHHHQQQHHQMHVPMHVTHIGHHPPPHMWQGQQLHHQQHHQQHHPPLHPMAAMKDHQHYLPPPQYASPQFREQQSPQLPGFGSLTNAAAGASAASAPSAASTPAASSAPSAAATPAASSEEPKLKKITSPLLLSNNVGPAASLPNSALDQLSAAASQSPYLTGQGDASAAAMPPASSGASAASSGASAAASGDLKTRLSELELVNDLFRSRVAEVEAAEQAARRSEASMRESEMLLRSALHRLETRNRVLEKRCKMQQELLDEVGVKVDDDDDVLEDSDVVLPPLRGVEASEASAASSAAASGASETMTSTTILPASPARRRRSSVGGHESAKREFDGLRKKVRVSDLI